MPITADKKPIANTHQQMLAARVDWEIRQMIFPHIKGESDFGFPFDSRNNVSRAHYQELLAAKLTMSELSRALTTLPVEYGDALSYVAFREIHNVIQSFLELTKRHPLYGTRVKSKKST